MQEEVSKGYMGMIASAAGLTIQRWDTDYGSVDLTFKSLVDYGHPGGFQPAYDIQLKATTRQLGKNGKYSFQINRRTYENLCNQNRNLPAGLAILSIPSDPTLWLEHNTAGLLAKSHLYFVKASDFPPLPTSQKSISIPFTNSDRFGPKEALDFMSEASQQWT